MATPTETPESDATEADVISLTVPADTQFARLGRIAVASIARRQGLSVRAIDDLRLAVDESFALLLGDEEHQGSVAMTFEVTSDALSVVINQNIADGSSQPTAEAQVGFEIVISDLVDQFELDLDTGTIGFSKTLGR